MQQPPISKHPSPRQQSLFPTALDHDYSNFSTVYKSPYLQIGCYSSIFAIIQLHFCICKCLCCSFSPVQVKIGSEFIDCRLFALRQFICCSDVSSSLIVLRRIGHDNLSSHPNVVLVFCFILPMSDNLLDLQDWKVQRYRDCKQVVVEGYYQFVHIQGCLDFVHCVKLVKILVMKAHYVVQNLPGCNLSRNDFETEIVIALVHSSQCYETVL